MRSPFFYSRIRGSINRFMRYNEEEMERIEKKELEILMMSRGLRNIINERIERNGGVKLKKKRKRKRKKKKEKRKRKNKK